MTPGAARASHPATGAISGIGWSPCLPEAETRILLLIAVFSGSCSGPRSGIGSPRLGNLDFLLRHPQCMARVLRRAGKDETAIASLAGEGDPLRDQAIKYRYAPWDPSYRVVLGCLVGRGFIKPVVFDGGKYQITDLGRSMVESVLTDEIWEGMNRAALLAGRYLDWPDGMLKTLIYEATGQSKRY